LLTELKALRWTEVSLANVIVEDRVVHLWNSYISEEENHPLRVSAENIPWVRRVGDHMRPVPAYLLG